MHVCRLHSEISHGNDVTSSSPRQCAFSVFWDLKTINWYTIAAQMPLECAAVGCTEYATKESRHSFHRFPKDEARKKEWVAKVNRLDSVTKRLWQPKFFHVLCSQHFDYSCFTHRTLLSSGFHMQYKSTLKPNAVPSIFEHASKTTEWLDITSRRNSLLSQSREISVTFAVASLAGHSSKITCFYRFVSVERMHYSLGVSNKEVCTTKCTVCKFNQTWM